MKKRIINHLQGSIILMAINFAKMHLVAGERMPSPNIHFGLERLFKYYTKYKKYFLL